MADQDQLLARLELWLAEQSEPVTLADVLQTGDGELFAAYVLKAFRVAARRAVTERIEEEAASIDVRPGAPADNAALLVFDSLAHAWKLKPSEQLTLLGLGSPQELAVLRRMLIADLPVGIIERLAVLLDIFHAISTLLPAPERWIRESNRAPPFAGRSALQLMLERDLTGMNMVRSYFRGQLAGP